MLSKYIFFKIAKDNRGFSIIEILVAATVVLILTFGILTSLVTANIASNRIQNRATGLTIARDQIEKIRNMPYDDIGTITKQGKYGNPPGTIITTQTVSKNNHDYSIDTNIEWVIESQNVYYKKIDISVKWENPRGSVSISSNIYGKSSLINFGAIKVTVKDAQTLENLESADVTIVHSQQNKEIVGKTNKDGQIIFYILPIGEYTVTGKKTGYASQIQQTTVVADSTTELVLLLQKPGELSIQVKSSQGSQIEGANVVITGLNGETFSQKTTISGKAFFPDLEPGDYSIESSKEYYTSNTTVATVVSGQITEVTLIIDPIGELLIHVFDKSNNPIDQATVNIVGPNNYNKDFATNAAGDVTVASLYEGIYQLNVSKQGFITTQAEVEIITGSTAEKIIILKIDPNQNQFGSMLISVVKENDVPLANHEVRVTKEGEYYETFYTDQNGQVLIENLNPGFYEIEARNLHWGWSSKTTEVIANQVSLVNFYLWD